MKWRVCRIAGIKVYVHWTFLLLLGWIAIIHLQHGAAAVAQGMVLIIAVFAIVVLHELGHALTARRFGIRTRDITLLPIGGVARLERMPEEPRQELLVALAGPAVNVVLAAVLYAVLGAWSGAQAAASPSRAFAVGAPFLATLLWVNVTLALFNLLPAFPMDGGRVIRALLAMRMPYPRATRAAATVGQGMALLFGLVGLFINPFLVFIALFVWMGAAQEAQAVETKAALGGIPVSSAMITEFHTLSPGDRVQHALDTARMGFQRDFPAVQDGHLVGLVTRNDINLALSRSEGPKFVGQIMHTEVGTVGPDEQLVKALAQMQETGYPAVTVVAHGEVVGMVTAESLADVTVHASHDGVGAHAA